MNRVRRGNEGEKEEEEEGKGRGEVERMKRWIEERWEEGRERGEVRDEAKKHITCICATAKPTCFTHRFRVSGKLLG